MSTSAAIATVTATLRHLLEHTTTAASVTTMPPSLARDGSATTSQLNIFLYKTDVNPGLRNYPLPGPGARNEGGSPPLALSLRYLLTGYGDHDDDVSAHQIIGEAMLALHDHMVLSREMIEGIVPDSELHHQAERLRITVDPMTVDEMTKLWTVFQTGYRLSLSYMVSVVLLESRRPAVVPLPVLRRGAQDQGVAVQPDVLPPFPHLDGIEFEDKNIEAVPGETVTFTGRRLDAASVAVRFQGLRLDEAVQLPASSNAPTRVTLQLPVPLVDLPAGVYRVQIVLTTGSTTRVTNALGLSIAPDISNLQVSGPANAPRLTLSVSPELAEGQQVALLLGGLQFTEYTQPAPGTLRFDLGQIPSGDYLVRLRVDGVDSRSIDRTAEPPAFLASREVTVP